MHVLASPFYRGHSRPATGQQRPPVSPGPNLPRRPSPVGFQVALYPSPPMSESRQSPIRTTERPDEDRSRLGSIENRTAPPVVDAQNKRLRPSFADPSQSHNHPRDHQFARGVPTTHPLSESTTANLDREPNVQALQADLGGYSPSRMARPARRAKAHVPSACINCKRAHLSCDVQRPCARCVTSGKQESCYDVQHKKRGRPRLRERAESRLSDAPVTQLHGDQAERVSGYGSTGSPRTSRPEHTRYLKSSEPEIKPLNPYADSHNQYDSGSRRSTITSYPHPDLTDDHSRSALLPVAFLNLDMTVMKTNKSFQQLIGTTVRLENTNVAELIHVRHKDRIQELRKDLREEKEAKNPTYMPPILASGEKAAIQDVTDHDAENSNATAGYADRLDSWTFLCRDGGPQNLKVSVRLAKTSIFFVLLTVLPLEQVGGPPVGFAAPESQSKPPFGVTAPPSSTLPPREAISIYRPTGVAHSESPTPYFLSPTATSTLPPTPTSYAAPSFSHAPTPRLEKAFASTYPPPPVTLAPFAPVPASNPARHDLSGTGPPVSTHDLPYPEARGLYQLPPLRSGYVAGSPPSRSVSSHASQSQRKGSEASERDLPPPEPLDLENVRGRKRTPPQSPTSAESASSDTADRRKRRRQNIGIHEVIE